MKCPYCGSENEKVIDTSKKSQAESKFSKALRTRYENEIDYRLRRRRCEDCRKLFVTIETYASIYDT